MSACNNLIQRLHTMSAYNVFVQCLRAKLSTMSSYDVSIHVWISRFKWLGSADNEASDEDNSADDDNCDEAE